MSRSDQEFLVNILRCADGRYYVGSTTDVTARVDAHKAGPAMRLSEKQRWVMAQLAADVKLTRRDVEQEFSISSRTAKR